MRELSKDDFYSISQLQIAYADFQPITTTATIYANGNNQVAVMVRVKLEDQDGNPASVPEDVVTNAVYLCEFNGGEEFIEVDADGNTLAGNGAQPATSIRYSRTRNAYCNAITPSEAEGYASAEADVSDGTILVTLYVSASELVDGRAIACGIKASGELFNSSVTGSRALMPSGQPFHFPSSVELLTRPPIDYSLADNLVVRDKMWKSNHDLTVVVSNDTLYHPRTANTAHGVSSKAECSIYTKLPAHKFVKKTIKRNYALGRTSGTSIEFFSDIKDTTGNQCADIVWGSWQGDGEASYEISVIFIDSAKYGMTKADFWLHWHGQHIAYRFDDANHHWTTPLADDAIRINFCNYHIPGDFFFRMDGWEKENWANSALSTVVTVADNYGNTGDITIKAENERWPALLINDHIF
ncbi:hypothetical protein [Serratia liquefaciens]|uniref:hypothetical protein n=1 Tax=Serratia liquefaciens TaxID=614 RepID=UPI003905B1C3